MKLTLAIDTPPQGRPRFTRTGIAYDPPRCRAFKAQFAQLLLAQLLLAQLPPSTPLAGNIRVQIKVYRNFTRATVPKFGDLDNLAKIILDAINDTGAIWRDDRFITELTVEKATAPVPRVELIIEEVS